MLKNNAFSVLYIFRSGMCCVEESLPEQKYWRTHSHSTCSFFRGQASVTKKRNKKFLLVIIIAEPFLFAGAGGS